MPELPPFNPSVSVFHFTSKVSSAKIAKYKLATERGMVVSHTPNATAKDNLKLAKRSASTSQTESNKRSRLKLNVRDPVSTTGDTSTVSKARQAPTAPPAQNGKKRAWASAFPSNERSESHALASPADSSELSSCDSAIIAADKTDPQRPQLPTAKESYGDFMSYYVLDDDDDDDEASSKSAHAVPTTTSKVPQHTTMKPNTNTKHSSRGNSHGQQKPGHVQQHPNQYPQPQYRPPPAAIAMVPAAIDIRIRDPDSVPIMIMKLEALSAALTDFGGVPPIPQSPSGEDDKESPVDNFLAMFGEAQSRETKSGVPLSFDDLEHPGMQDLPLTYGIQFIMNALKSWAEQRLAAQMNQQAHQARPGRPSQSSSGAELHESEFQQTVPTNLFDTPEGRAISAFRAVVESGCLRVNAVMPLKLAKALRLLYMQIDHLINQSGKGQPPWRCLSYVAQIEANRIRIDKWKEAQVKAQEEVIRQQQLSHQQMMRQMGLPDHLTSTMFYHQSGDHEAPEHERRNSSTDLVRLPTHPRPNPIPSTHYPRHSGLTFASYPAVHNPAQPYGAGISLPRPQPAIESTHASQSKAHSAAFLPRSGQSMKFSFPPIDTAALHTLGSQVSPSADAPTVPGPTQPSVAETTSPAHDDGNSDASTPDESMLSERGCDSDDTQVMANAESASLRSNRSSVPWSAGFAATNKSGSKAS